MTNGPRLLTCPEGVWEHDTQGVQLQGMASTRASGAWVQLAELPKTIPTRAALDILQALIDALLTAPAAITPWRVAFDSRGIPRLLAAELPEVDAVIGFESYSELPDQILNLVAEQNSDTTSGDGAGRHDGTGPAVLVGSASVPFRGSRTRPR